MRHQLPAAFSLIALCTSSALLAQDGAVTSKDDAARAAMDTWFATAPAERGPVPEACAAITGLTSEQAAAWRARAWESYRRGAQKLGWADDLIASLSHEQFGQQVARAKEAGKSFRPERGTIEVADGKQMPYIILTKGKRPETGWPMFFSMHGGGRSSKKQENPHGWQVNSREWLAQIRLFLSVYPDGLYFVPRMVDDNDGRWYFGYNHEGFGYALRRALLFADVDPNRVYMMGISEGGYGTDRLATYMTDRLAAACSMAAGSGPGFAENLRNLPYRTDVGENDNMYDRRKLAQECHVRLEALRAADPGGYVHVLAEQAGRGHGIDYGPGPAWLTGQVREPHPRTVVWTVRPLPKGVPARSSYWLSLDGELPDRVWLRAQIDRAAGSVRIDAHQASGDKKVLEAAQKDPKLRAPLAGCRLTVHLGDELLDLDRPVTLILNGEKVREGRSQRGLGPMLASLAARGDPELVYPVAIELAR